jgi:chromosome partitioning protein
MSKYCRNPWKGELVAIVSVINQKGGVAKTTTSINIAASWAKMGKSVLLIDLDPQSSATKAIFGEREFDQTIYDVLINRTPPEETILTSELFGFDVIPSEILLSGVDIQIAAHFGRERLMRQKIESLKRRYDAILIDCPPSLGLLTINALMASRDIIIPICPEYFSMKGIELILQTIQNLRVGLDHKISVRGIVITRYRDRKIMNNVIAQIRDVYGLKICKDYIPDNIAVEEAHHQHVPVYKFDPSCKASKAYHAVSAELWV